MIVVYGYTLISATLEADFLDGSQLASLSTFGTCGDSLAMVAHNSSARADIKLLAATIRTTGVVVIEIYRTRDTLSIIAFTVSLLTINLK